MNTFFYTKKSVYQIITEDNRYLRFYPSNPNAGQLIWQHGGPNEFLAKCVTDEREYKEVADEFYGALRAEEKAKRQRIAERQEARRAQCVNDYEALVAKYETIPTTIENLKIILRYLSAENWGLWRLPKLDRSYTVNQYDVDGQWVATITFDEGLFVKGMTNPIRKFKHGCAANVLPHFFNIERL